MNLIVLKGRLTADPEIKAVGANQTKVCNFSIAVNRRFEKDKADFINCQAWGNTAEFVAKYFSKGKEMSLTGELHIDQREENGAKKYFTKVKVDAVEFCGSKNEDNNSSVAPTSMSAPAPADFEEIDDDDLPFA